MVLYCHCNYISATIFQGVPVNKNSTTVFHVLQFMYLLYKYIFFTKVYVIAMAVLEVFLTGKYNLNGQVVKVLAFKAVAQSSYLTKKSL